MGHPAAQGGTPQPGLPARQLVWRVLQAVAAGAYADGALERELQRQGLSAVDRALATELAYGAIRQRRLLDAWIDALGKVSAERQPPALRWLLHLGLYQLLFCQRVPAAAAVSTSVELARQGGLARLAPVVNALLRACQRRRAAAAGAQAAVGDAVGGAFADAVALASDPALGLVLPEDPVEAFALRHSLPSWLAADLLRWLPAEAAAAFAAAANRPPALDLRCNPLRTSRAALLADWAAAGLAAAPIDGLAEGVILVQRSGDLRQLPGYREGHWSVQDRAAQRIAPLLAARPGERILDACAAPGGKSTQLAELIGDQGEVWAVDRAEARLRRLQRNAERLGLASIRVQAADATTLAATRPEWQRHFDRVLVDAPCSGLGTLARHADARWRIAPEDFATLLPLQQQLLAGVAPLLRPGGRLVYATCTVDPRENQGQIETFLAAHAGWLLLEQAQRWPGDDGGRGDGFYAAVLIAPPA